MKISPDDLLTPIYLKLSPEMPWPEQEKVFYLLSGDGLFLCRNHPFFRSSVRAPEAPAELARHKPFLKLTYPKLPQRLLEKVVGFFAHIGLRYGAEAAVLLVWNKTTERIEIIVPEQRGMVSVNWLGHVYPSDLTYAVPELPSHLALIGDIHSHVDMPAYASVMDKNDELHRPGLHIVVGRIRDEPPEFHIEATVDGTRFEVKEPSLVLAGYERRRLHEVPQQWLDKVTVKSWNDFNSESQAHVVGVTGRTFVGQGGGDGGGPQSQPNGNTKSDETFTAERLPPTDLGGGPNPEQTR